MLLPKFRSILRKELVDRSELVVPFHALSSPFLAREIPGDSWSIIQEMRLAIACLAYNILKP
jgi:hypothetical protein